ncbi:response regulator transcription factor [Paenibacillus hexagrammi]|uniref:Response regulator transcription factor n=1 Tax=Paenibacillus hexagrammi TaxID=2908839 RepID=A0ABY3SL15_9BACL|nr:response regulator transcription factor [Paenibacillus sp. YPD9-1]UJF34220.1 response regulator transcription factor [Paenibacillus sp. YPD9-1]
MSEPIRVLLVEDDPDWIEGIKWVIEKTEDIILLGSVSTKADAMHLMRHVEVDVVLLDIMLHNKADGLDAIQDMLEMKPGIHVIMLSSMDDEQMVWESFVMGACNYIMKSSQYKDIPVAIREAHNNQAGIHASAAVIVRNQFQRIRKEKISRLLTNQERKILSYVYLGKKTAEIKDLLTIEEHTVENYITSINKKFKTNRRKDAALAAKKLGLLDEFIP